MRAAVSGASGFIGAELAAQLTTRGHEVVRIGRRNDCELPCDLALPETVDDLDLSGVEVLVHCAGVVDEDFATDSERAFRHAIQGTTALFRRAAAGGVARVVSLSTAHVYGPLAGRISEETPTDPRSDYAIAHFAAEQILKRGAAEGAFAGAALRPCAVFGIPRLHAQFDRWHLIPFAFPLSAVRNGEIVLKTPGQQRRNFIDIADLVDCVMFLLDEPEPPQWRAINPVGPDTMSVIEFAELCADLLEREQGRRCMIRRPEGGDSSGVSPLEMSTVHAFARGTRPVSAYVADIMRRVLGDEILS